MKKDFQVSDNKYLPWSDSIAKSLWDDPGRLHHALLLTGPEGIGKGAFAEAMAARLLCEKPTDHHACETCDACRWYAAGNHPDYRKITLEILDDESEGAPTARDKKKAPPTQIRIEQIRALEDFVFVGSHRQGRRVIVIDPADALNQAASNSLLKVLEEPPSSVYFLLVSSNPRRLIPTLRSRCRHLVLGLPSAEVAMLWLKQKGAKDPEGVLKFSGGAPLKALEQMEQGGWNGIEQIFSALSRNGSDPVSMAAQWESIIKGGQGIDTEQLVDALQKWLHDLAGACYNIPPHYLPGRSAELAGIASKCSPVRLQRFNRDLLKIRATARHPLNPQLFLEDMAARYVQATTAGI